MSYPYDKAMKNYTRHSPQTREKIKEMRRNGASIQSIMRELGLAKTTVWHNVQGIFITKEQLKALRINQGGSRERHDKAVKVAEEKANILLSGNNREYVLILTMLYWAEGHKKHTCSFTNTDPIMIRVYLSILREVFKIDEDSIGLTLRIF